MFNENGLPIEKKCVIGYIDLMGVEKKIEEGSQWALAGPRYFKYKGEWLNDLRNRD